MEIGTPTYQVITQRNLKHYTIFLRINSITISYVINFNIQ